MPFLQFCADLSKKSKSIIIKAIYIHASERSRYAISENGIVFYAMTYCFEYIRVCSQKTLLNFCWVSIFYHILIDNISWTAAQTPINHINFWKSVMRNFRCIYVNCFNKLNLGFLLRSAQNCKECTFLDKLRTITQEENMETRQMSLFTPSPFPAPTVYNNDIHFCIWKKVKIHFHMVPSFIHSGL